MIAKETLTRLNAWKGKGHFVTSVYLDVNPVTCPKGEYFATFRNLVREEVGRIAGGQKLLSEDIRKIENYIKGGKKEFKKTLVLFSSLGQHLWEVHHLSVPFRNQVVVDKTLYLKPLTHLMEIRSSDLIVLVDKEHARLFKVTQGEIQEYAELTHPEVPGKHKGGGWYGRDENRFRRHIDFHISLHLKDVIKEIEIQMAGGDIGRMLLGGTEESLKQFQKMLPQATASRVAGTFAAEMQSTDDEILDRASEVFHRAARRLEEQWVEELLTRANKDGSAAMGLEDVLTGLQEGKIHRLIYQKDLRAEGFRYPACGLLSVREMQGCPFCKVALEQVDHLMDYALQRALDQGAQLVAVSAHEKLREAGAIGAILRY
ncbi:MAG: hypothetical protein HZA19_04515 [Nitrospirae bacterium]|nr:hypothetical protein [Nitrospirota bacterium]